MQENIAPNTQDDDDGPPSMDYGALINLVSHCRILYDMSCKDYKNTALKDSCWQEVGRVMNQSGNFFFTNFFIIVWHVVLFS